MDSIAQNARFRLSALRHAEKHGVKFTALKYGVSRQSIYRWRKRYDGTLESLSNRSRRPRFHPKQHTEHEIKLILNMRRRNPREGLVVFWVKLRQRGYRRTVPALFRLMRRLGLFKPKPQRKIRRAKPYEAMDHPGQRVQIDVKHVPAKCLVGEAKGQRFYQYTAIDEFSRLRYLEAFDELSTFSSTQFLMHALDFFGFQVECVQTDNGPEFTNRLLTGKANRQTLFEQTLGHLGIQHKCIRPYTPRHNGKVERSHRKDKERFYARRSFYSLNDLQNQLKRYLKAYNTFPIRPLGWISPMDAIKSFYSCVTYV